MEDREAAEEKARERKAVRDGWELAKKQKEKSFQWFRAQALLFYNLFSACNIQYNLYSINYTV